MGLDPGKHLGKDLVHMQPYLHELKRLYGINVCGEGGEYETLTLDCSLFKNARIVLDEFKVLLHSPDSIAPVGVLHPLAFHLEPKTETCTRTEQLQTYHVHEVGENLIALTDQVNPEHVEPNDNFAKPVSLNISRTRGDTVSIGCWIQKSSGTSEDLQEDLAAVLKAIDSELFRDGSGWKDVLYIHLYLANMKQFAAANAAYVSFITEEKCPLGVPSRSTIELPLAQVGLGHVYVEVLVARDQSKQVLHVQSISCWAPSCIGPYSQATFHNQLLYMAGQLGLDPSTMMLCTGGASGQLKQAMRNCEAVADSFNSDISSSGILLVIYCSDAVVSSEKVNMQEEVETLFRSSKCFNLHKGKFHASGPILLYVLVPDLPKGALVEVKPPLYIPKDKEITAPTETLRQYDPKLLNF